MSTPRTRKTPVTNTSVGKTPLRWLRLVGFQREPAYAGAAKPPASPDGELKAADGAMLHVGTDSNQEQ